MISVLAIGGSLGRKKIVPATAGTFPTATPLFAGLLVGVVVIVVGLTYFPVVALGPGRRAPRRATSRSERTCHVITREHRRPGPRAGDPTAQGPYQAGHLAVRAHHRPPGRPRRLRQARPPTAAAQPGHVRRAGRQRVDHRAVLPGPAAAPRPPTASSPGWWRSGCGSPCCSPTSPRRWPRAGARPRPTRCARPARRPWPTCGDADGRSSEDVPSTQLQIGDLCVVAPGELIPGDGDVVEGIASVDESAITGESAPVIRESGGDRSAVTGGTRVLSDGIVVQISTKPGESFIDRMIALVEGASRQKTPNEIALNILLAGLTIIFLLAVVTLQPFAHLLQRHPDDHRAGRPAGVPHPDDHRGAALGHRHRRHGPAGAAQRAGHVGPGGGGGRRRVDAAAGQDGHHHLRQPHGRRVPPGRGHRRAAPWPRSSCCPRWPTRRPKGARS